MDNKEKAKPMGQVIQIDEARIRDHLGQMVRGTVEDTLDARPTNCAEPAGTSAPRGARIRGRAVISGLWIPRPVR